MASTSDDTDALTISMQSLKIGKNDLWPSWIGSSREVEGEIIANLDQCFLPPKCYALLPFPMPQSKDRSLEVRFLARSLDIMAHLPLFAVFPIITPTFMCMLSGMPSAQNVYDCDEIIARLRIIYKRDFEKFGGSLKDFSRLETSRRIVEAVQAQQLKKSMHEHNLKSPHTHSWPKHVSSFTAFNIYNTVITTILSLAMTNNRAKEERDRLNALHAGLNDSVAALFKTFREESELNAVIASSHDQLAKKLNIYEQMIPDGCVEIMRSYSYKVLKLFERCIMSMMEIPDDLQKMLVCTRQQQLSYEDRSRFVTASLLEEQEGVVFARNDFNARVWIDSGDIRAHARSPNAYLFRPYHEWVMQACSRLTFSAVKTLDKQEYLKRVLQQRTLASDGDWSAKHYNYNERTGSLFSAVH